MKREKSWPKDEFMQTDSMLKPLFDNYMVKKQPPPREEAVELLRFFAVFAVGMTKLELPDLATLWSRRTDAYALLLQRCGCKRTPYFVRRRARGFNEILTEAFYGIG